MTRAGVLGAIACAVVTAACGNNRDPDEIKSEIEVTGCLTGTDDTFVLTELNRADTGTTAAAPATESYNLVGDASVLRQHVGQQVRVAGMTETPDVAIMRESSPPVPAEGVGTGGSTSGATPQVNTQARTRLEVSTLRVRSVAPTGSACAP